MSQKQKLSDAFFFMLGTPTFSVHLSLRVPGQNTQYRLGVVKNHAPEFGHADRVERANNIADLLVSQGLHFVHVITHAEAGLLELVLNPLMARHPMFTQVDSNGSAASVLNAIIDGILYEINSGLFKGQSDMWWVETLGLNSGKDRISVPLAYGTRLHALPGLYNLHQIKNPSDLEPRFGVDFANAIERVAYIQHWDNDILPEETPAIPLERFEKLARAQGFDKFFYESDHVLWVSKSA